ncbi:MarR family winged helix-turn-helix transcriptional regulator [Nocardioides pantholopis]|uniref:MarR family winged helix-turn-helix transcriptional regulator n=1 Tax=Nocardioides pantholopis TaxID=2483798 RepID=UPI0013E2C929|nr:MarR family transcriptional regulator [Nocardioides pantholopis]
MTTPRRRRAVVDRPGSNVALDLFVLDQHLGALLDTALAPAGLTATLYAVYSQLGRGPLTPGQLSEDLGVRPTTLSGYLKAMERDGHATRTRNARDGRSRLVELTDAGHAKVEECRPLFRSTVRRLDRAIGSAADVAAARAILARLDDAIIGTLADLGSDRPAENRPRET